MALSADRMRPARRRIVPPLMAILLALLSAGCYGTSDFLAGLASRRYAAEPATALILAVEFLGSALAVVIDPGHGPSTRALAWGAVSGIGAGVGRCFSIAVSPRAR